MMQPPSPPLPEVNFEHLRLLSIFYYVLGAIYVMVALIPLIHLSVGIAIVTGVLHHHLTPSLSVGCSSAWLP